MRKQSTSRIGSVEYFDIDRVLRRFAQMKFLPSSCVNSKQFCRPTSLFFCQKNGTVVCSRGKSITCSLQCRGRLQAMSSDCKITRPVHNFKHQADFPRSLPIIILLDLASIADWHESEKRQPIRDGDQSFVQKMRQAIPTQRGDGWEKVSLQGLRSSGCGASSGCRRI